MRRHGPGLQIAIPSPNPNPRPRHHIHAVITPIQLVPASCVRAGSEFVVGSFADETFVARGFVAAAAAAATAGGEDAGEGEEGSDAAEEGFGGLAGEEGAVGGQAGGDDGTVGLNVRPDEAGSLVACGVLRSQFLGGPALLWEREVLILNVVPLELTTPEMTWWR